MPRYTRNTAILAKIETTYGTDAVPTGAANAILVSNATVNMLNAQNVPRDLLRGTFGGSEQLVGTAYKACQFDVEIAGSGTAGTAPAWGPLLRACAFAETVSAGNRVEYTPVSTGIESVTIYYHADGVLHKLLGARGTVEFTMNIAERPIMRFSFSGIDGGETAATNPTPTLTAWKTPVAVTDANTVDITLGATYSTGALSGGTAAVSRGLSINAGNSVQFTPFLTGETVDITQREVTGSMTLDVDAAGTPTLISAVKANTTTSLGFTLGTVAGNTIIFHSPSIQRINPQYQDVNGRMLISQDLRFLPVSGNDELRIVVK